MYVPGASSNEIVCVATPEPLVVAVHERVKSSPVSSKTTSASESPSPEATSTTVAANRDLSENCPPVAESAVNSVAVNAAVGGGVTGATKATAAAASRRPYPEAGSQPGV